MDLSQINKKVNARRECCESSEGDLNARPIGLQPIALPLSYQNYG
jgi:hypothetical protein